MRNTWVIILLLLTSCSPPINNFEGCVAAGNPVMESSPRMCSADGETFVEQINCVNFCGNKRCDAQPCTSASCPCVESEKSCPQDCKQRADHEYKSTDTVACALMRIECAEGTEQFIDESGCGCKTIKYRKSL